MSTTISGTNGVTFPDSTSMQTGQQACKAWVNFNGSGTVAIRDSYNVSSITDNGTGNYSVNFTNAMPDVNYSVVVGQSQIVSGWYAHGSFVDSTTYFKVYTRYNGSYYDVSTIHAAVFS